MRILMIAPHPFFEPRGAPFAVFQHIKALLELGHEVDLVTYPMGKDLDLPNLHIYRAPSLPFVRRVKPGFSLAKFPLDLFLFLRAFWVLTRRRYYYLFTHEEAALMGIVLSFVFGCKHLYYVHSNLSQLVPQNFFMVNCMKAVQKFMIRKADELIAFYPEIVATIRNIAPGKPVHMILPPAVDEELPVAEKSAVIALRQQWGLEDALVLLYTGTLEKYQGIDILLQSASVVRSAYPAVRYVIIGGISKQVASYQKLAHKLEVADIVRFVEQRPLEEMPLYMQMADVLLSPRSSGTHTPLKLYTYLRSGKPILATNILAHTQVLTPEIALLVPPTPSGLAQGTLKLLQDKQGALELGSAGKRFASTHYSWSVFLEKCSRVYNEFVTLMR